MADIAAEALQVQIRALIDGWRRGITETKESARGLRGMEGEVLRSYSEGYADALDRCVQALELLI